MMAIIIMFCAMGICDFNVYVTSKSLLAAMVWTTHHKRPFWRRTFYIVNIMCLLFLFLYVNCQIQMNEKQSDAYNLFMS